MPAPINYMGMMPERPDLAGRFARGFKVGEMLGEGLQDKRYQQDMLDAFQNPSAEKFVQLSLKYPEKGVGIKSAWDMMDDANKQAEFSAGAELATALESGATDIAKQKIQEKLQAFENSGQDPGIYKQINDQLEQGNINGAKFTANLVLSHADPVRYKAWYEARQAQATEAKTGAEAKKTESEAKLAAIKASFAQSQAVADLEKTGWDIAKLQNDIQISKENQRIAAMEAEYKRSTDDLKKQELQAKIEEAKAKREQTVQTRASDMANELANNENLIFTTDSLLDMSYEKDEKGKIKTKNGKPIFTNVIQSATGPISTMMPTISQDTADFQEKVETLKSQVTMANIGKMKGVLSDTDLKVLQGAVQSLSLRQSPESFTKSLEIIKNLTNKANEITRSKYGAPSSQKQSGTSPQESAFIVPLPNGKVVTFPNQQAADAFKKTLENRARGGQ